MFTIQSTNRTHESAGFGPADQSASRAQVRTDRTAVTGDRFAAKRPNLALTTAAAPDVTGMTASLRPQKASPMGESRASGHHGFFRHALAADQQLDNALMMVWFSPTTARTFAQRARHQLKCASQKEIPEPARAAIRDAMKAVDRALLNIERASGGDLNATASAHHELVFANLRLAAAMRIVLQSGHSAARA